jgi:hypothetical protein
LWIGLYAALAGIDPGAGSRLVVTEVTRRTAPPAAALAAEAPFGIIDTHVAPTGIGALVVSFTGLAQLAAQLADLPDRIAVIDGFVGTVVVLFAALAVDALAGVDVADLVGWTIAVVFAGRRFLVGVVR